MIAFVDAGPGTRFLPQAAELNDGRVVTFFRPLVETLKRNGGTLPVGYPDSTFTDEGRLQRDAYWNWFSEHWNADKAVRVIEDVIGDGGRPRWIDYRTTLNNGETLHLHVVARGDYDTGIFAYNLISRGLRFGLRIVGSLKSQPALNSLPSTTNKHKPPSVRLSAIEVRHQTRRSGAGPCRPAWFATTRRPGRSAAPCLACRAPTTPSRAPDSPETVSTVTLIWS
jgi:hypothetical protein